MRHGQQTGWVKSSPHDSAWYWQASCFSHFMKGRVSDVCFPGLTLASYVCVLPMSANAEAEEL